MPDSQPHFGHTRHGLPVHLRAVDHLPDGSSVARFNKWLMVSVTEKVGTAWCAYLFCLIALVSLPSNLVQAHIVQPGVFPHWLVGQGLVGLIQWIAQTFLQLVLLAIILAGQNIQSVASDARSAKTFEDTEIIVDRLDEHTAGGIRTVLDAVGKVGDDVAGLAEAVRAGRKGGVT